MAEFYQSSPQKKHKKPVSGSWKCNETHLRSKEEWVYLYRAVDKQSNTIDKSGANKAGIEAINLHLALLFMLGGIFYQLVGVIITTIF